MGQLTILKNDLLPALSIVAGAVDKKQALAILANIFIGADTDKVVLTATDLEIEISAVVPCACTQLGAMTVPARKFIDIIRSLDDGVSLNIIQQAQSVQIKLGRSQFKLATLPAEQFPSCNQESADFQFSVNRNALIHLFQSTHFAMSQQDVRIFLNGLLFNVGTNSLTAVATDGHRMAICKTACETGINEQQFLLPRKGVLEIVRLLNATSEESVIVSAGKSHLKLQAGSYSLITKLVEARFPPYTKAIPKDNDKFVLIDKDSLKRCLARITILAHEKSKAVLMHVHEGGITLIANNQEQEEATEFLEANVDGNELKIGINASYLLDVLNFIPDATVRLSMSTTDKSILVESLQDENYQYIIMPMKL